MKVIKRISLVCIFALLASCVSVSQEEFAIAHFGEPPINYSEDIKRLMSSYFKDPVSAQYTFETPRKGMSQDGWAVGNKKHFGYLVKATINAKNGFGGYTGAKPYVFLFSSGQVSDVSQLYSVGRVKFH